MELEAKIADSGVSARVHFLTKIFFSEKHFFSSKFWLRKIEVRIEQRSGRRAVLALCIGPKLVQDGPHVDPKPATVGTCDHAQGCAKRHV